MSLLNIEYENLAPKQLDFLTNFSTEVYKMYKDYSKR